MIHKGMGKNMQVQRIPRFPLESGEVLEDVVQAYTLEGKLNVARDNLVLVFHSLSATPDPAGDWWTDIVGRNRALDTGRWAVLCPNLLGSCFGTTGPANGPGSGFPSVTLRDMVRLVRELVRSLGVSRVALATGGSLGGMLALEWAASFPELTAATVAFAAPASLSATARGWNHIQREMVRIAGSDGLRVARMAGMMLYRSRRELEERFGRQAGNRTESSIAGYLDHHGNKILEKMDRQCYLTLLEAISTHDVGRGRGGTGPALQRYDGKLIGVGTPGDQLYPAEEVYAWTVEARAKYRSIRSEHGHDGFLLEPDQVGGILRDTLPGEHQVTL